MAHKRRHLMLLQKVRESKKALTPAEIKELENYEAMTKKQQRNAEIDIKTTPTAVVVAKTAKKTAVKKKKTVKKTVKKAKKAPAKLAKKKRSTSKKGKKSTPKLPISTAEIKNLAFETANFVAADEKLQKNCSLSLAGLLDKYPQLKAAYERGLFLHNLSALAGTAVTITEAEQDLCLEAGQLETMLEKDTEVSELWNQTRLQTIIDVKKAIVNQAKDGKPAAARQVEALLKREIAAASINLAKLTEAQLMKLANKTRQTIHAWRTKEGLQRNADGTYSLAVFLAWFEEFAQKKVRTPAKSGSDELAGVKTQRLQLALEKEKGDLLDRGEVIAAMVARYKALLDAFSKQIDNLPEIMANQPAREIKTLLEKVFEEIRRDFIATAGELKLTEEQENKFKALLAEIKPENDENEKK